jgi:DNA-binding NarL/FixJ family response regulator
VSEFGPEDRELIDEDAQALFQEAIEQGGLGEDDPRFAEDPKTQAALELFLKLSLLSHDVRNKKYVAIDPSTVSPQIVGPLSQEGAYKLTESAAWAKTFSGLAHTYRRFSDVNQGLVRQISMQNINPFLAAAVSEAEEEILAAQPQATTDPQAHQVARKRDFAALERGVTMRTLYQHRARRSTLAHNYVAAVAEKGAEVRTLDEFFMQLVIIDRRIAVIPGADPRKFALAIFEPSMLAYLVDVFERHWERARPFTGQDDTALTDIAADQRAMAIRMLVRGYPDGVSAKRLGVSPRTYATYVSDLKAEFDVQTRFQLGYTMGKKGITGGDQTPDDDASED